jgi:hypothetical protein
MKRSNFQFLTTLAALAACSLSGASLNNLYFGLDNMRGFKETYWWFLADGRFLHGLPMTGVTPADFDAACTAGSGICGTYVLNGSKLALTYKTGRSEDWTYAVLNGGIQLNYLILTPVGKYPAGAKLNGTFSRAFSAKFASGPSSAVTITAPSFFTFKSDGTFQSRSTAGVETTSAVKDANTSSSSQSQSSGTYTVHDNVLMLITSGKSERHMIFPAPGDNLNLDGQIYTKQP